MTTTKITTRWHNPEKTVIIVKMESGWTWSDMYPATKQVEQLLDSVTHTVCTLYDFTDANQIPPHAFIHIRNLNRDARPNQEKVGLVGLNIIGQSLLNLFIQIHGAIAKGSQIKIVSTIENAYKFFDIEYAQTL